MYETKPGEDIFVVGSIKELGEWKDINKAPLKWSAGHVWVTKDPLIITNQTHFNYKYVLERDGNR